MQSRKFFFLCLIFILGGISIPLPTTAQEQTEYPVITAENADQLEEIAIWGRGTIHDVEWSPKDDWIAVGGSRGVWLLDAHDLTAEPLLLEGHTDVVTMVAFHPDGEFLASASRDGTVRIWDLATFETVHIFDDAFGDLVDISFDGRYLAYHALPQNDDLWQPYISVIAWATREPIQAIKYYALNNMQFAEDSRYLITGFSTKSDAPMWGLFIYDIETGEKVSIEEDFSMDFYPNLQNLTIYIAPRQVVLSWDMEWFGVSQNVIESNYSVDISLNTALIHRPTGRIHYINQITDSLAFNPDSSILLSLHDNKLYFWDVETTSLLYMRDVFSSPIQDVKFSPNGQILVSSDGHNLTIYDIKEETELGKWEAIDFAFSTDSHYLALSTDTLLSSNNPCSTCDSRRRQIEIWELEEDLQVLLVAKISMEPINHLFFLDNDTLLLYAREITYDEIGQFQWQTRDVVHGKYGSYLDLKWADYLPIGIIGDLQYAPLDLDLAFCGAFDDYLLACNSEVIYLYGAYVNNSQFLETNNGLIHYPYFDLETGRGIPPLAINSNGQKIAIAVDNCGGEGQTCYPIYTYPVTIHQVNGSTYILNLTEENRPEIDVYFRTPNIRTMDFHPTENLLVIGEGFELITFDPIYFQYGFYIWDVENQIEIASYDEGHTRPVTTVDFSPDGRMIATGSEDGTVRLWAVREE